MLAVEFGEEHGSCEEAMEWRRSLGPKATQADAWRLCKRGDWMGWQFERLSHELIVAHGQVLIGAAQSAVARAIRRAQKIMRGVRDPRATVWRRWAREWLDGKHQMPDPRWVAVAQGPRVGVGWATRAAETLCLATPCLATPEEASSFALTAMDHAEAAAPIDKLAHERLLQAREIRRVIPEWPGE